ncbi:MAG: sialidase family protein [Tunicatimonas sp.]|uniref:sialidase family protein n=1 Tax=Tunicatimonas sp. TaxID=1940096 RepID=UPI003C76504C
MRSISLYFIFFCSLVTAGFASEVDSIPSVRKVKDILIYQDSLYYSSFPSIAKLPGGEYLLAFRRAPNRRIFGESGNDHVDPNSYLVTLRSTDGESWPKEPSLLYAHPFGGSQDPCLLLKRDGTLLCTSYGWAFLRPKRIEQLNPAQLKVTDNAVFLGGYTLHSKDNGYTWSEANYPPSPSVEVRRDALGQSLPAYNRGALWESQAGVLFWAVAVAEDTAHLSRTSAHLLTSNNAGQSWKYASPIAHDSVVAFNETSLYETPNGDLVAFLRTANLGGQAAIARSTDGGKSFSAWQSMGFQGYPQHALRLPNNQVLLTYGYRTEPYGIRARILNAECTDFATAPEIILREDGGGSDLGYPWSVLLDEKYVLVVYYFNQDNGLRHIAGTILEIE